jgi:transposase-like protein
MKGHPVLPEIKEIIIKRASAGDKIDDLAREFNLYANTIRKWMAQEGVSGISPTGRNHRSVALMLAKSEREKKELMEIIGKLTVELTKGSKKKSSQK